MRKIVTMLLLSVTMATILFFTLNTDLVEQDLQAKLFEIGVWTVVIFILVCLFYYINRALIRKVRGIGKKKPSENGKV